MNSCCMAKKNGIRREKETIQSLLNNDSDVKSHHVRRFHEGLINKSILHTSNLIFRFPLRRFTATTFRCLFEHGCVPSQLTSSLTNFASNANGSVFIFSAVAEVSSASICASSARFKAMSSQTQSGIVSSGETCGARARYDICVTDHARSRKTAGYCRPRSFWSIKDRFTT